jgi:excisionase family DNA binding protein
VNLADAIRKAANKPGFDGMHEQTVGEQPKGGSATWPQEPTMKNNNSPSHIEMPSQTPEPLNPALQNGNAVRLEIFLNGEQMAGMLKAIMAGQHSVLTVREAASYLRVSPKAIERMAVEGEIPAVEIDGRYRFPKSNLDDWLASQSAENEEEKDVA